MLAVVCLHHQTTCPTQTCDGVLPVRAVPGEHAQGAAGAGSADRAASVDVRVWLRLITALQHARRPRALLHHPQGDRNAQGCFLSYSIIQQCCGKAYIRLINVHINQAAAPVACWQKCFSQGNVTCRGAQCSFCHDAVLQRSSNSVKKS